MGITPSFSGTFYHYYRIVEKYSLFILSVSIFYYIYIVAVLSQKLIQFLHRNHFFVYAIIIYSFLPTKMESILLNWQHRLKNYTPPLFSVIVLSTSRGRRLLQCQFIIPQLNNSTLTMSAKFQDYKDSLERSLNDKAKPWTRYFELAEKKTGVNRVYLFVGTLRVFYFTFIYIFSSGFDVLFCVMQVWWRSLVYI